MWSTYRFFVDLVFNIRTLKIFLSLEDFSCWLSTPHFATISHEWSRFLYEFSEKFQSIYLEYHFFFTVKHSPVFCRSCFNTVHLKFFFHLSTSVVGCRRHISPSCIVPWMKEFFCKIFVLDYSIFGTSSFLLKIVKYEALLSPLGWNKNSFQSKNIFFPIRQILTADFERVSIVCALAGAADKNTKRLFSSSNWVSLL